MRRDISCGGRRGCERERANSFIFASEGDDAEMVFVPLLRVLRCRWIDESRCCGVYILKKR